MDREYFPDREALPFSGVATADSLVWECGHSEDSAFDDSGTMVASNVLVGTLGANQMLTFTSAQLESLMGYTPPTTSSKWRVAISANPTNFEVINYAKDVLTGILVLAQPQTE